MVFLFNKSKSSSLISFVNEKVNLTIDSNINKSEWNLYIMTCYITEKGLWDLFESIKSNLEKNITNVEILVDKEEWAKLYATTLIESISIEILLEKLKLFVDNLNLNISINPVDSPKLFHAKSFALIHHDSLDGFVISTSANLTSNGLTKNLEFCSFYKDKDYVRQYFTLFKDTLLKFSLTDQKKRKLIKFAKDYAILSMGKFYNDNEIEETTSSIKFNDKGIEANRSTIEVEVSTSVFTEGKKTISFRLIDHIIIKNLLPSLVPKSVIQSYSLDTLLGRWIPYSVQKLINNRIEIYKDVYMTFIKERYFNLDYINTRKEKMRNEIKNLADKDYIKTTEDFTIDYFMNECHRKSNIAFKNEKLMFDIFFDYHEIKAINLEIIPNQLIKSISRKINNDSRKSNLKGITRELKELYDNDLEDINCKQFLKFFDIIERNEKRAFYKYIGELEQNSLFSAVISNDHNKNFQIICPCVFDDFSLEDEIDVWGRCVIKGLWYYLKDNKDDDKRLFLPINQIELFKIIPDTNIYRKFLSLPLKNVDNSVN